MLRAGCYTMQADGVLLSGPPEGSHCVATVTPGAPHSIALKVALSCKAKGTGAGAKGLVLEQLAFSCHKPLFESVVSDSWGNTVDPAPLLPFISLQMHPELKCTMSVAYGSVSSCANCTRGWLSGMVLAECTLPESRVQRSIKAVTVCSNPKLQSEVLRGQWSEC